MSSEATQAAAQAPAGAPLAPKIYSPRRTGWAVFLLAVILANNFSDRAVLNILAQPIEAELHITDTQFGFLTGLAFATFYAIFGYPLAHLAGRYGRINVITVCALMWSAMAAACGLAANYVQLMLFRFGVGIGESGLGAPGHAIIADYVRPERRTSTISLFMVGVPIGVLGGSIAGGWVAQHFGWRAAFVFVALPGFLLAPLLKLTVQEPPKGNWDASRLAGKAPEATPPIWEVLKKQFSTATSRHFAIGTSITVFAGSGSAFLGAYFVRRFGVDYATLGLIVGGIGGISGVTGMMLGGFLTDWAAKWSTRWYARIPAIALVCAAPMYLLAYLQNDWRAQAAILIVSGTLAAMAPIPYYGVTQNLVPGRMRAPAAAVVFFLVNFVGLGLGPVFYGMAIDWATQHFFAASALGDYFVACGKGGRGAIGAAAAPCHAALASGTRWALACGFVGFLWAAVHYAIAARTVREDLIEAEKTN